MTTMTRLLCVLAILLVGCQPFPSPAVTASATPPSNLEAGLSGPNLPLVRADAALTTVARVGGEIDLLIDVTNVGPRDIKDLTIIVNEAYLANMAVLETSPRAIRHDEQGGEYFTFATLAKGATQEYVIRLSPNQEGEFSADVDVAEWAPAEWSPLPEADGGVAEFTYGTDVVPK